MKTAEERELSEAQSQAVAGLVLEELARRRMSRKRLAADARISLSTLEKALNGNRGFTLATLVRLEQALSVSLRPAAKAPGSASRDLPAPAELGAYSRAAVHVLEGRYLTLRPSFEVAGAIYAYRTDISWDGGKLVFAEAGDELSQRVGVVGPVGENGLRGEAFDQGRRCQHIVALSGGDAEADRPAEGVGGHVDFGGQSSSGTPQSLVAGPPFPPAACWCALTKVLSSIRYWLSRSRARSSNTRSHTPAFAQRVKRLCAVFHLPYRSGRSCQCAPERNTHKTPLTNKRLSEPVRPGSLTLPGSKGAIRSHCVVLSS